MSSVVVTGGAGRLGHQLIAVALAAGHEAVGVGHGAAFPLELTDGDAVTEVFRQVRPHLVVHAAAWTDVDGCEADPVRAELANIMATRRVAAAAEAVGAHLVYVSTDYVFGGESPTGAGFGETDAPNPLSVYGRTKLAGEYLIPGHHTIARISWLCSDQGPDLVHATLRHALDGDAAEPMAVVADQMGQATFAADAAPVLLELGLAQMPGTFHVTNQGVLSRYELAAQAIAAAGLDPGAIRPVGRRGVAVEGRAPRPANSVLLGSALAASGLGPLRHYGEPLTELVDRLMASMSAGGRATQPLPRST